MKMRSALLGLIGAWTLHAAAAPQDDRWRHEADPWSAAGARAADQRSWYGHATGSEGSFASKPAAAPQVLALEQPQSPIPEPSTWALMGAGLGWVTLLGWRRRRRGGARD